MLIIGALAIIVGWHSAASKDIHSLNSALISTALKSTINKAEESWLSEISAQTEEMVNYVNRSRLALRIASLGAFVVVLSFLALWYDMRILVNPLIHKLKSANASSLPTPPA